MFDERNVLNKKDSDNKKSETAQEIGKFGDTHLLQIAVVLLAIVSFFTTANGMSKYIFSGNKTIAYAASAAIQGILLALSMNLPEYLRGIKESSMPRMDEPDAGNLAKNDSGKNSAKQGRRNKITPGKIVLIFFTFLLTGVAIFCSSWFSYIYIAEVIHNDSWGADSELLVQQGYRSELYDAQEYARTYRIYLEQALGEEILFIEKQAEKLRDNMVDFGLDWDEELETYVTNGGAAAASYMAPVINAMRTAAEDNASQESRDLAVQAVDDAERNITAHMVSVQQNLDNLDTRITMYNNQIQNLTTRVRNAEEGTDTTALTNAINNYTQLISDATRQQTDLQTEYMQLNTALMQLPVYKSYLGLNSSTSSISIRNALMQMQSEFFKQEPDEALLMETATNIFESLRNGAATTAGGTGSSISYTELMVQMNQLIGNLGDYSEIKDIETALSDLITELRTSDLVNAPASTRSEDPADSPEPLESPESPESSESSESQEPAELLESPESSEPSKTDDTENESGQWQRVWGNRIERLKAQIGAMPTYSDSGNEENSVLTGSQISILRSYDRDESSKTLDDIIRRYISSHNAIYQGIIYLQSPYRSLALFALILALSFDLAGFVFGVVISGRPQTKSSTPSKHDDEFISSVFTAGQHTSVEWSILETQNHYKVLTGDYERRDDCYYYTVFCNGILEKWEVKVKEAGRAYGQGIYNVDIPISPEASLKVKTEQALLFDGQEKGPADGVLKNCRLWFKDGSLIKEYEEEQKLAEETEEQTSSQNKPKAKKKCVFIASIDEYVPFHIYSPDSGENRTVPASELKERKAVDVDIAVIALGKNGTRVAAVYIIEK